MKEKRVEGRGGGRQRRKRGRQKRTGGKKERGVDALETI